MRYPLDAEPATHGLEGLANLRNTMLDNDLQWVGLRCSSKHRSSWRQVGSDLEFMGFIDGCKENRHFKRPLSGRLL